jgi:hypothetical protein
MNKLPQRIERVGVPPVKRQGIKTKLVPFIFNSVVNPAFPLRIRESKSQSGGGRGNSADSLISVFVKDVGSHAY